MEITGTGNAAENLNGVRTQASARKASKTFSAELETAVAQESAKTAPAGGTPLEYIVQKGDNLWKIGKLYKINPYQIARDNRLSNPDLIRIGQKLIINPSSAQATPDRPGHPDRPDRPDLRAPPIRSGRGSDRQLVWGGVSQQENGQWTDFRYE
jgi:LysM repeat protein